MGKPGDKSRIRWQDNDVEAGRSASRPVQGPGLERTRSHGSMSIRSVRSNTGGGVDPSAALPIQYRTV